MPASRIACLATCILLFGCGGSSASVDAPQTGTAPVITTQPANETVTAGQQATFSVVASGTPTPAYQWQRNSAAVSGATGASYTTPVTTSADSGATYTVVVSNSAGSVTSAPATLSVLAATPTIISFSPTHAAYGMDVVVQGSNFTATTTATINGVAAQVMAHTSSTLTLAVPQQATSGPIVVTDGAATVTSTMTFTVDPYGPPITITAGGTYSGNWESLDPQIPAVSVQTSQAVIIENCRIQTESDAIQSYGYHPDITVRNCTGQALNPNVRGQKMGYFVIVAEPTSVVVEHNSMTGFDVSAEVQNYPLAIADNYRGQNVRIRYNVVHNVEGRFSDGNGGFITGNFGEGTSGPAAAFTVWEMRDANVEIAWNEITDDPEQSQTEDVISIPESRGTASNPIDIHDNYIEGVRPANSATYTTFSGCGIQTGDSPSKSDVGYVHVHDNQVVGFQTCGLSISSGHNIEFDHNRAISAASMPNGTLMAGYRFPLDINDYYWNPDGTATSVADPYWHDNSMHDNAFAAVNVDGSVSINLFHLLTGTVTATNNVDALGHPATRADEEAEYTLWKQKLATNGLKPGP